MLPAAAAETKTSTPESIQALNPLIKGRFLSTLARGRMSRPPERSERVILLAMSVMEAGRFGGWPPPEASGAYVLGFLAFAFAGVGVGIIVVVGLLLASISSPPLFFSFSETFSFSTPRGDETWTRAILQTFFEISERAQKREQRRRKAVGPTTTKRNDVTKPKPKKKGRGLSSSSAEEHQGPSPPLPPSPLF